MNPIQIAGFFVKLFSKQADTPSDGVKLVSIPLSHYVEIVRWTLDLSPLQEKYIEVRDQSVPYLQHHIHIAHSHSFPAHHMHTYRSLIRQHFIMLLSSASRRIVRNPALPYWSYLMVHLSTNPFVSRHALSLL